MIVLPRCDIGRIEIPASDVLQHYLRLESGLGGARCGVPSSTALHRKSGGGVLSVRQYWGFEALGAVAVVGLVDCRRGREYLRHRQPHAPIRFLRFLDRRVFLPSGILRRRGVRRRGALIESVLLPARGVVPDLG